MVMCHRSFMSTTCSICPRKLLFTIPFLQCRAEFVVPYSSYTEFVDYLREISLFYPASHILKWCKTLLVCPKMSSHLDNEDPVSGVGLLHHLHPLVHDEDKLTHRKQHRGPCMNTRLLFLSIKICC